MTALLKRCCRPLSPVFAGLLLAVAVSTRSEDAQVFTLTADHIKLLRSMAVTWDPTEAGAPTIDPERPYGGTDLRRDVRQITGISDKRMCDKLHRETEAALQILAELGELSPGKYSCDHKLGGRVPYLEGRLASWRRPNAPARPVQATRIEIDFTDQHRKLLRAAAIEWNEDWVDSNPFGDRCTRFPASIPSAPTAT